MSTVRRWRKVVHSWTSPVLLDTCTLSSSGLKTWHPVYTKGVPSSCQICNYFPWLFVSVWLNLSVLERSPGGCRSARKSLWTCPRARRPSLHFLNLSRTQSLRLLPRQSLFLFYFSGRFSYTYLTISTKWQWNGVISASPVINRHE